MEAYQMDNRFKLSVILMGVDWSKAAKLEAVKDIARDNPRIAEVLSGLGLVQSALDKGEWWHWSTRE